MKMASIAGGTALQAARVTDRTRSMFRAILAEKLAENGIANTDNVVLEQEMVMFFKLSERRSQGNYVQTNHVSAFTSNQAGPAR
jgi:hypothetical protein